MDSKLSNPYMNDQEDSDVAGQENINAESPPSSTVFNIDGMVTSSTCSSLKRRRAIQKRVVQIPMKETEGSRLKGESNTPPSDSWAWRKYGQKPIKGSPYPRGYYRCSSSKGCPARKQVERSRVDPTMLVVTYSSEHNHPWPLSRNKKPEPEDKLSDPVQPEDKFADELGWFGEMTSSAVLESPVFAGYDDADVASVFMPMREEDESLFADLGELPECAVVFRRAQTERERCYSL